MIRFERTVRAGLGRKSTRTPRGQDTLDNKLACNTVVVPDTDYLKQSGRMTPQENTPTFPKKIKRIKRPGTKGWFPF